MSKTLTRILRDFSPLFSALGIQRPEPTDSDGVADAMSKVAHHLEMALVSDEHSLAEAVARIDSRFASSWSKPDPRKLLEHARRELLEIERAMSDADESPDLSPAVVEECGDAILLLLRVAMVYGASALQPIQIVALKTARRLSIFEVWRRNGMEPKKAWDAAKSIDAYRTNARGPDAKPKREPSERGGGKPQ